MLIVLPMHPFIMFPALFLISNASMHLRSSSLFMLQCRILQVMDGMSSWRILHCNINNDDERKCIEAFEIKKRAGNIING